MIPSLPQENELKYVDLDIGVIIHLDLGVFENDEDVRYYAGKMGLSPYTPYMALTKEEVQKLIAILYEANAQTELLLEAETQLKRAQTAVEKLVKERDEARKDKEVAVRVNRTLNWVFIPSTLILTGVTIYLLVH